MSTVTFDIAFVFTILALTIGLFASDRLRLDFVALLSLIALLLGGILTPNEALAGFANPLVLMIAGLFVVGAGIFRTGVADAVGRSLSRLAGNDPTKLLVVVMLMTAALSAFISSTGTVAVMLPVVVSLAKDAKMSPAKLLIPLAFGSLLGGMLTLIGTPPNIVVSGALREAGLEPFRFFSFTPIGLVMLGVGVVFMTFVGRFLLPDGHVTVPDDSLVTSRQLSDAYNLEARLHKLRLPAPSPLAGQDLARQDLAGQGLARQGLAGQSLADADLRRRFRITVVALEPASPHGSRVKRGEPETVLHPNDVLYVRATDDAVDTFVRETGLDLLERHVELPAPLMVEEVILPERSRFVGKTLRDTQLRRRYGLMVVSMKRAGRLLPSPLSEQRLQTGDTLLVTGSRRMLSLLRDEARDMVVLTEPSELLEPRRNTAKAPFAVTIMLGMLVLMTFGLVANVTAVLVAAVAMVGAGCLDMDDAYRSINWESVVLIAAILPMATALSNTGGMDLIVARLLSSLGNYGPFVMMTGLFVLTSVFSQVISNTATTILVAPIALQTASTLGVSPESFLMTVAIAASTAFATPIASPVNALVLNPGGYRFRDFVRVGLLMQFVIMIATLLSVPFFFPF